MTSFWKQFINRFRTHQVVWDDLPPHLQQHLLIPSRMDLEMPLDEVEFTVLDVETTGLNARKGDRIVSLSAIRLQKGRIDLADAFHELVDPQRDIPSQSIVVHEILPNMVNGRPGVEHVLPKFIKYIGYSVLVAHHSWLDMSFLNREMIQCYGFPLQNIVLDTAVLDKMLQSLRPPLSGDALEEQSSTLHAVAQRYHVAVEELHSSFWDAMITAQIFQQMLKSVRRQGVATLKDLLKFAKDRSLHHGMGLNGSL
jgi:DNA polymerase-3 subunit epsilon